MKWNEQAERLRRKAAGDEEAMLALLDKPSVRHSTNDVAVPRDIAEFRRLGPYAVEFRYDDILPGASEPFDRHWAASCVEKVRRWVDGFFSP